MVVRTHLFLSSCLLMGLAGCASPFAQPLNYNPAPKDTAGTITLSDPKLYTRPMLVMESAKELAWLDQLLKNSEDSTKVKFTPDLVRETEQISALAASLGIKYDPAAGLNYRRVQETAELQQEINVIELKASLLRLKGQLEKLEDALKDDESEVGETFGTGGTTAVASAASGMTGPSTTELTSRIDAMLTSITSRLDKEGILPKEANVLVNPFDDFRDRTAYRDMIKSARNAAAGDESHDANASALFRLNFQAMVVPDPDLPRSLGAVQMKILPPDNVSTSRQSFLDRWLVFQNLIETERSSPAQFVQDGEIAELLRTKWFTNDTMFGVALLQPMLEDANHNVFSVADLDRRANWQDNEAYIEEGARNAVTTILSQPAKVDAVRQALCMGLRPSLAPGAKNPDWVAVEDYAQISYDRVQSDEFYVQARNIALRLKVDPGTPDGQRRFRLDSARRYLKTLADRLGNSQECASYLRRFDPDKNPFRWQVVSSGDLAASENDVRIYDIGPREQVERVSTVARAANSLSLAASIAASAPGSGVAGDAAVGYSRQAMGRASAMERVPLAVGYALAGKQTFGWVLGPRATVDARGKVKVEQLLKPFDLTVDFSIPNWWGDIKLAINRQWAPTPRALVNGTLAADNPSDPYIISVAIPHRDADYRTVTHMLIAKGDRPVRIRTVTGIINACDKVSLRIRGSNLWRAQSVYVIGQKFEADKFSILADNDGIDVEVPAMAIKPELVGSPEVEVVTPFGSDRHAVTYVGEPSGDACKAGKAEKPTDPTAVTISAITPELDFHVPSTIQLIIAGKNLNKIKSILLHDLVGLMKFDAKGESMTVTFDANKASIPAREDISLKFLDDKGKPVADARRVRIRRG